MRVTGQAILLFHPLMAVVETIAEGERPLVVALQATTVAGKTALHEVVRAHVGFEIPREEAG